MVEQVWEWFDSHAYVLHIYHTTYLSISVMSMFCHSVVVHCSSCLWFEELGDRIISLFNLSSAPCILWLFLHLSLTVWLIYESLLSTLGLFDIVHVTVSIDSEHAKDKQHISITFVVERVWLVPGWEFAHIPVGDWCLVTWLKITRGSTQSYWLLATYANILTLLLPWGCCWRRCWFL